MMHALLEWPGLLFVLFVVLLRLSFEVGARLGRRDPAAAGAEGRHDALDGVMFALLGLLLAFSFSGAASRFQLRAAEMVDEANAIGTARLRVAILPADAQPPIRETFRRYIDSRMLVNEKLGDPQAYDEAIRASAQLQREIWALAVAAGARPDAAPAANLLLLPAVNEMIDITTTRAMATHTHTPLPIQLTLLLLAMICTAVIGHGHGNPRPHRLRLWSYCTVVALALYVCIDLEYPRYGLIRLTGFEKSLIDLVRY